MQTKLRGNWLQGTGNHPTPSLTFRNPTSKPTCAVTGYGEQVISQPHSKSHSPESYFETKLCRNYLQGTGNQPTPSLTPRNPTSKPTCAVTGYGEQAVSQPHSKSHSPEPYFQTKLCRNWLRGTGNQPTPAHSPEPTFQTKLWRNWLWGTVNQPTPKLTIRNPTSKPNCTVTSYGEQLISQPHSKLHSRKPYL